MSIHFELIIKCINVLFLTTFCLQRYYGDILPHYLLDDYHLTLHVCRTGIMYVRHKEGICLTFSCACPDPELTKTFVPPSQCGHCCQYTAMHQCADRLGSLILLVCFWPISHSFSHYHIKVLPYCRAR